MPPYRDPFVYLQSGRLAASAGRADVVELPEAGGVLLVVVVVLLPGATLLVCMVSSLIVLLAASQHFCLLLVLVCAIAPEEVTAMIIAAAVNAILPIDLPFTVRRDNRANTASSGLFRAKRPG